jgi:hypothetical protein
MAITELNGTDYFLLNAYRTSRKAAINKGALSDRTYSCASQVHYLCIRRSLAYLKTMAPGL